MARGRAFSLIELLVVLAVLGVLAALLFPVFASAREKGRSTTCLSNVGQLAKASLIYAGENDERYANGRWLLQIGLARIEERLRSRKGTEMLKLGPVLRCSDYWLPTETALRDDSGGYAHNACLNARGVPDRPANVVLVGESATYETINHVNGLHHQEVPDFLFQPDALQAERDTQHQGDTLVGSLGEWGSRRHLGRGNYAFADGHARSVDERAFYIPRFDACGKVTRHFESWMEERLRFAVPPFGASIEH